MNKYQQNYLLNTKKSIPQSEGLFDWMFCCTSISQNLQKQKINDICVSKNKKRNSLRFSKNQNCKDFKENRCELIRIANQSETDELRRISFQSTTNCNDQEQKQDYRRPYLNIAKYQQDLYPGREALSVAQPFVYPSFTKNITKQSRSRNSSKMSCPQLHFSYSKPQTSIINLGTTQPAMQKIITNSITNIDENIQQQICPPSPILKLTDQISQISESNIEPLPSPIKLRRLISNKNDGKVSLKIRHTISIKQSQQQSDHESVVIEDKALSNFKHLLQIREVQRQSFIDL